MSDRAAGIDDAFSGLRPDRGIRTGSGSKRRISLGFVIRMAALLSGAAVAGQYAYTNVLTPVSLEGVVNAPLITLRAPIDGTMVQAGAVAGQTVTASEALFSVHDSRIDERPRADLAARLAAAMERRGLLEGAIAALDQIGSDLARRDGAYGVALQDVSQARLRSDQAAIIGAASAVAYARKQEDRARQLTKTGVVPQAQLDGAIAARVNAEAALSRAIADREAAALQLKAERKGVYLQNGFGGSSYHLQRLDEIRVRQIDLWHQVGVADAEIQSLRMQLQAEDDRLARLRTIEVPAAAGGQVTSVYVSAGTQVLRGNPLADILDCGNLYVEANVAAGWFNRPRPGSAVTVRVYDIGYALHGSVRALRDSAMAMDASRTMPAADRRGQPQLTVLVDLDPRERVELQRQGCPVGRPAKVSFE